MHTAFSDQFQTECISGCVCPDGLIDDGRGGCVEEEDCPCVHNKEFYAPGERIDVDCNECTCQNGNWACTQYVCYGTCIIYGSGHYITFDGKYYDFDGNCEYVASQDYCGPERHNGSFSIITENVPCGTTGVTCSKSIKVFLGRTELKLEDKQKVVITRDLGNHVKYWTRTIGLYLVVEASNGVMLIWDKKTTMFVKLTPNYKGKVCGLCGNFDDKANNDFTTRSQVQANNALDFGNSWKRDSKCPDVDADIEPCDQKLHRKSWAEKECSLIKSEVFAVCHPQAIFCDYYNPTDICEWHYEPCGREIMTCKILNNIATNFSVPYLEGCYPRCPPEKPFFSEETFTCEDLCGCYVEDIYYPPGSLVPTDQLCVECICIEAGTVNCSLKRDCCVYNGTEYGEGDIIVVENGVLCYNLTCENGTMVPSRPYPCKSITTTVPTTTTSAIPSSTSTAFTTTSTSSTTPCPEICEWSPWIDVSRPLYGPDSGDYETYENIRAHGIEVCTNPLNISCRAVKYPALSFQELGQKVTCDVSTGLVCENRDQVPGPVMPDSVCLNYEVSIYCCDIICSTTTITTTLSTTTTEGPMPTPTTPTPSPSTPTPTTTTPPEPQLVPPPTTTTTSVPTPSTAPSTTSGPTTAPCPEICEWSPWIDVSRPLYGPDSGDYETYDNIRAHGIEVCTNPLNISCRAVKYPALSFQELGQKVKCDVSIGLVCENRDQVPGPVMPDSVCLNYEVTILEEYSDPFVLKSVFEHLGKGPALAVAVAAVAAEAGIRPEARPR
ncbi:UNVERIFIED_CONTAM: hypothetical protein K2H54_000408 [Gekko kuhli]